MAGTKDSRKTYNAAGKKDLLLFDPEVVKLVTDKKHYLYDERVHEEPDEGFIANVDFYGVIEPIVVVKDPESGETLVTDGRKRTKGLRIANARRKKRGEELHRLPAVVKRVDAGTSVGVMITLNEQRTQDTPTNLARKASRMLELGKTEAEVAIAIGKSVTTVKNLIALVDAPASVRSAVEAGKITVSDGYKAARVAQKQSPAEAKKLVDKLIEHAPRTPGKKRSKNARKAREITGESAAVNGSSKKKTAATIASASTNHDGLRAPNVVENVKREIEDKGIVAPFHAGVVAALSWVLGDDKALATVLEDL